MRLYALVEGKTEASFFQSVIAPQLKVSWAGDAHDHEIYAIIVETGTRQDGSKAKGGGDWLKWRSHLNKLRRENKGADCRFTMMIDLYAFPYKKFPDVNFSGCKSALERATLLEQMILKELEDDYRLIPYVQLHEFEALVLASLEHLLELVDVEERPGVELLIRSIEGMPPEAINDGKASAPSKRLESFIVGYDKDVHGPLAVESCALEELRSACPHFGAWLTSLEGLAR